VEESPSAQLAVVGDTVEARGVVRRGSHGYLVDGRLNDAFKAVNMLWDDGVEVRRFVRRHGPHRPGDFWIENATDEQVAAAADVTGVDFQAMDVDGGAAAPLLQRRRIAMYHRYYGGNMDEGWTRWLLENFSFAYTSLLDPELKAGNLNRKYDVIILPEDDMRMMIEGRSSNTADQPEYPEEFRSGFGEPGVQALEAFVRAGGTLVTLGESGDLPIERFHLPVRNVLEGLSSTEFWSPGSTLRVNVDNTDPLTFGMPEEALATFLAGSQAYQLVPVAENQKASRPVTYLHRDVLESGWLLGEAHLADRAAVVSVALGRGSVVLLGFRAQHRAQTHGTYKLLFNALVGSQEM
jgi:hypothetical protein